MIDRTRYFRSIWRETCTRLYLRGYSLVESHGNSILFLLGLALIFDGGQNFAHAYNQQKYGEVCNNVLTLVEGQFGALMTAIAGVGAVVASAMGGFKMAWACLVVSVGSFILKNYVNLFFEECSGGGA